ncbi:MAG: NAD-dependent epimerase/dehydratase family protein [Candidatus Lokiarchaeota archaeon]|nr:NAD-dependent epimerase/dehydratase family protein [Candidatus Lokiarchaeota archaeon]
MDGFETARAVTDAIVADIKKHLDKKKVSFQDKKILITGGAGFLGSYICEVLAAQGAKKVICYDNLSSGMKENVDSIADKVNFVFHARDVTESYDPGEPVDLVMHMASRASPFEFSHFPIQIWRSNTIGTMNGLEVAKKYGATFFFSSTSEVYGDPDPSNVPTPESYWGHANPNGPRSCYDESKRAGEAIIKAYELEHGIDARIARIFNTYGPRIRGGSQFGRVVPNFIEEALKNNPISVFGDGMQTRSFTFVSDEAEGLLRLAYPENKQAKGEVINIGNNREDTVIDLARLIIEMTGSKSALQHLPLPKDDPGRRCPILDKAKRIIDWQPRTLLKDGLKYTIPWFKFMLSA